MKPIIAILILTLSVTANAQTQVSLVSGPARAFGDRVVERTFAVENEGPYTLEWRTRILRGVIERGSTEVAEPGQVTIEMNLPAVRARVELMQEVQITADGKVLATKNFPLDVFPLENLARWNGNEPSPVLGVIDNSGVLSDFMEKAGWRIVRLSTNRQLLEVESGVTLVAPNHPDSIMEPISGLRPFVEDGGTVIFLEQSEGHKSFFSDDETWSVAENDISSATALTAASHPLLLDLKEGDLANWAGSGHVSARPLEWTQWPWQRTWLASSDEKYLPLVTEFWGGLQQGANPVAKGRVLLCQLDIATQLDKEPAAQLLLRNIIHHALTKPSLPHAYVMHLAIPEDGVENDKFKQAIPRPEKEDMTDALAAVWIVGSGEETERGHGPEREIYPGPRRVLIIQSPFGDDMLPVINGLIKTSWPADMHEPAPSLTSHELPGEIQCKVDYTNPLTWGIPSETLNAALAKTKDVHILAPEEATPFFHTLTEPGILSEYKQGDVRIILCAMPVGDSENKTRERVMNQLIANTVELLGKEHADNVMGKQTR